jgi:hypothetical protein
MDFKFVNIYYRRQPRRCLWVVEDIGVHECRRYWDGLTANGPNRKL